VAQSLFHDHVPVKKAGLRLSGSTAAQKAGLGRHTSTSGGRRPDWQLPSMAAFADAVAAELDRPD